MHRHGEGLVFARQAHLGPGYGAATAVGTSSSGSASPRRTGQNGIPGARGSRHITDKSHQIQVTSALDSAHECLSGPTVCRLLASTGFRTGTITTSQSCFSHSQGVPASPSAIASSRPGVAGACWTGGAAAALGTHSQHQAGGSHGGGRQRRQCQHWRKRRCQQRVSAKERVACEISPGCHGSWK